MNRFCALLLLVTGCATVQHSKQQERVYLPLANNETGEKTMVEAGFFAVITAEKNFRLCIIRPNGQSTEILKPEVDQVYILPQEDFLLTLVIFLTDARLLKWMENGKPDESGVHGYLVNESFLQLLHQWFNVSQWPPDFKVIKERNPETPTPKPAPPRRILTPPHKAIEAKCGLFSTLHLRQRRMARGLTAMN